jgi:heptaprenyl diphosphate synthase
MDYKNDPKTQKTVLLVTCASLLQLAEAFFPQPVPGIKLGLANMITIVALVDLGFGPAIEIAILRTVISSLLLGTFLSTTFILSFTSAITSSLIMGFFYTIMKHMKKPLLSLVGISLLGAVAHNLTQLAVVYFILIRSAGVLMLLPWLGISGVIMGWITGIIASRVCAKLESGDSLSDNEYIKIFAMPVVKSGGPDKRGYISGDSFIHRADAVLKIIIVFVTAIMLLFFGSFGLFAGIFVLVTAAALAAGISTAKLFSGIKKIWVFLAFSFLVPLIISQGSHVLFAAGPFKITSEALSAGGFFVVMLALLMLVSDLMIKTTEPEKLITAIESILKPLSFAGISGKRTSHIIVSSWTTIPEFWDRVTAAVKNFKEKEKTGVKGIIVMLTLVIVALYRQTEI